VSGDPEVVVGAGHNGLIAACYLARAGRDVLVVEALDRPGGGARTEETVPGYHFDLHSVAHNLINLTDIPADLDLAGAGLEYQEMDPFATAVRADGRRVRFYRSVEATLDELAASDPGEARAYRRFLDAAEPVVSAAATMLRGRTGPREGLARLGRVTRAVGPHPFRTTRDVLGSYDALLGRYLASDLTRGPVAAFAAHAGVGPAAPGGALFALWQAAYHRFGQWHGRGGAQALTDALTVRLAALGGRLRCSAPVARLETASGRVRAVILEDGERIAARSIITALDPKTALLELLDPPLGGRPGAELRAARRSNVVQVVLHVATDRLPGYPDAQPADWTGLQSYVVSLGELTLAWAESEAAGLPERPPLYAFTPSALDDRLAPPGHHTVYVACPAAPARLEGGWPARRDEFVEQCLRVLEQRAPGFGSSVQGVATVTPDEMERVERWPGAHPMHLDLALRQLGPARPTRRLGRHRTPIEGLYVSGAGTSPTGGIAGTPGQAAARALLHDRRAAGQ